MKSKDQIIRDMCLTVRHDFGLPCEMKRTFAGTISAGMTPAQQKDLWRQMEQIYNNVIEPALREAKLVKGERPANGTKGVIISTSIGYKFRVYKEDDTFTDYDIQHPDLEVQIIDEDASFYEDGTGAYLDISSEGLKIVK